MDEIALPVKRVTGETVEDRLTDTVVEQVLPARYLLRDEEGRVDETPAELFRRVAENVATPEDDSDEWADRFEELLTGLAFVPNSPTLMNAGGHLQQLAACFVLSPSDSLDSIFETVGNAAKIFQSGGGTGYAFSRLRPRGALVRTTGGTASGPVSFMHVFDEMCEQVKQGGKRRGAQMAVLRADHPDIGRFCVAKREEGRLSNFNVSVGVTDEFYDAVVADEAYDLVDPRTGEPHVATDATARFYSPAYADADADAVRSNVWRDHAAGVPGIERFRDDLRIEAGETVALPARFVWALIVDGAWQNGEPGLFALDTANRDHAFDVAAHPDHRIETTNPCGEQPLEQYEACNLGHVNLSVLVAEDRTPWPAFDAGDEPLADAVERFLGQAVDGERLDAVTRDGTRFLDDVVTMSQFPIGEISETVGRLRKVGLGVMGLAELLLQLGVAYDSPVAREITRQLMARINRESTRASHELARERGAFDAWDESKYADPTAHPEWFRQHTGLDPGAWTDGFPVRNHGTTSVAPTGCVDEDSLISTDNGLTRIDDFEATTTSVNPWDNLDVKVATDGGIKSATAIFNNGLEDVKVIETDTGFRVSATPDHRFRTVTRGGDYIWLEAQDFESGDPILLQRDTFEAGTPSTLDTSELEEPEVNTDPDLSLPQEMTPELAEFLGYFVGDGYVHDGVGVKLIVESSEDDLDQYLRTLGTSLFGVEPTVEDRDTRHMLTFGGKHLPRYFDDNGWTKADGNQGEGAASAFIPDQVLSGTRETAEAFLSGLFEADGCASRKVELSTVSETLADQVQTLLLSLGHVFARDELSMEDRDDRHGERPRITLRGANGYEDKQFVDEIGFVTKDADYDLTGRSYRNDTYPVFVAEIIRDLDGYDEMPYDLKHRVTQSRHNGAISRKTVRDVEEETGETIELNGRPLLQFYVATVSSVSDGTTYTKDISVPENNTYIANGFVTHNTTSMIGNTSPGCEPVFDVVYAKRVGERVSESRTVVEFNDYFLRTLDANGVDTERVEDAAVDALESGTYDGPGSLPVPDAIADLFVTADRVAPADHVRMQAAIQEHVDGAISKTINLPHDADRAAVERAYVRAYESGCKGVTVFRARSRETQGLSRGGDSDGS